MTDRLTFSLTVTVQSPFLFRGLDGGLLGLDAVQLRDDQGHPVIPADQIRGVLREALTDLADIGAGGLTRDEVSALFGSPSPKEGEAGSSNEPERTAILFSDLVASTMIRDPSATDSQEEKLSSAGETTRVEIDDSSGAARDGMMQVLELVAPFGAAVPFRGEMVLFRPRAQQKRLETLLRQALALIPAIGSYKSPGFGEVLPEYSRISFKDAVALALPAEAKAPCDDFLRLRVQFDRPLLVDAERVAGNAFRGRDIVPGAVIKGALARRLTLAGLDPREGPLSRMLARLGVSHAFPESRDPGRPGNQPLPLSLVAVKTENGVDVGDALDVPEGCGAMIDDQAALFIPDWKGAFFERAKHLLGRNDHDEPSDVVRTHTRIDAETGTAKDQDLYTTIARSVCDSAGQPRYWLMDLDLGRIAEADKPLAHRLIEALLSHGLDQIGKTGAHAKFEVVPGINPSQPKSIQDKRNRYAVVLTTPALMLDPLTLCDTAGKWIKTPRDAYDAYWTSVLPGVKLHGFYAQQQFTGGYLARRHRPYGPDRYRPFLLTQPGAVFDLETADIDTLAALCRYGLPVPALTKAAPLSWENCPYVPENGYGRITADYLSQRPTEFVTVCHV